MWDIIQFAQIKFNRDINSKIIEEEVYAIDGDERQNKIDGSNKDYYVQNSYNWYIGDLNGDGEITAADVTVWQYDSVNDTKTELTVSSVDSELGKITLSTAPASGMDLTITYAYCPVDVATPEEVVRSAVTFLATSIAFIRLESKDFDRMALGKLSLAKTVKGYSIYAIQYNDLLYSIKSRMLRRTEDADRFIFP